MADTSFCDMARTPGDQRDAHAAFPRHSLAAAELARAALIPGAVIAGEQEERVLVEPVLLQRLHDLPHGPIQLADDIAVNAVGALAAERRAGRQRDVRIGMGEIKEERAGFVVFDEFHGTFGVTWG